MKVCRPELVLNRPRPGCKVSVILIDWGVRESFHCLEYLNRQTAPRDSYELLWLEFYDRQPEGLRRAAACGRDGGPALDKWIVAGYPDEMIFNKHRLYNLGILAAEGEICVICDSDAIFTPTFIDKLIEGFAETPWSVLHLDEVRNSNPLLYPFCHPSIEEITDPEWCPNWRGTVSAGLDDSPDLLHDANYGACMAARRADLIAVGGADEHLDYLGYVCGPYDLTFRLVNHGLQERWLRDEYLYHTWHPNQSGDNHDYHGPHDGRFMSLRALTSRVDGRVPPCVENPWVGLTRLGDGPGLDDLLRLLEDKEEPEWRVGCQPAAATDGTFWLERDFQGFNLYLHRGRWYGLKAEEGAFDPRRARRYRNLLQAETEQGLKNLIAYYNSLPTGLWERLWVQPSHRLPLRILRRLGKEVARLF